jgi:uncharacterized Ntn-hydrolase superfamily protein
MRSLALAVALLVVPGVAEATYSIAATDQDSGQVGGAGTSCVGFLGLFRIYGSAPGHGVVHAQSYVNTRGRDEAVRLLETDTAPADIITAITDAGFDSQASTRQYAVVDLSGRAAAYTGADNGAYAADVQGTVGDLTYSVQGNVLTSQAVIDQAQAAFIASGCDLADRLILALEAGAVGGEGDNRCTPEGIPSDTAFVHVDLADGTEYLHIEVNNTKPDNPLIELRRQYDEWRLTHPCPGVAGDEEDIPNGDGGCGCASNRPRASLLLCLLSILLFRACRRK